MPRPIHFEIHADDMDRAQRFYEAMFGWTFAAVAGSAYRLVKTGAGPGIDGGMMQRRGPPPRGGEPLNSWVCTLDVADVDDCVSRAPANGGTLALPRMAIPGVGWLAYIKDSEGNILGLMQQDPAAA